MRKEIALALCLASCAETQDERTYGDPTSLSLPTESLGIRAWVVTPATRLQNEASAITLTLAAHVLGSNDALEVWIGKLEQDAKGEAVPTGLTRADVVGAPGPEQRFSATVGLTHGTNTVFARIVSADRTRVRTMTFTLEYEGEQPGLTLGLAAPGCPGTELSAPLTNQRALCVHGRVTSKTGTPLQAMVQGAAITLDANGRFQVPITLPANQTTMVKLDVLDSGRASSLTRSVIEDELPPTIQLTSNATETSNPSMQLAGSAQDPSGIAEVALETQQGGRLVLANAASFSADVQLAVGLNKVTLIAKDGAGNEARKPLELSRSRVLRLGAPRAKAGTQNIEVDRQALADLLDAEDQKQIELVALDLETSVKTALERIRDPQKYGQDTSMWGAPERNMQRILRTTPDSADLTGTSVEKLLQIANGVGLPAPRVLADLLDLSTTGYVLDLDVVTQVIIDDVIGTHPNVSRNADGKPQLPITMYDVLQDLSTLSATYGPSGQHPGFFAGQSFSQVLEPGFLLSFPVSSNLTQYDALDLSRATKDYLFLLEGERVLDFNVLTDDFAAIGLVDEPTIDLDFSLHESATNARAGSNRMANPDAADPGFFRGDGQGFSLPRYMFEHIAAEASYRIFHRRYEPAAFKRTNRYDAGSIKDAAVLTWERGWINITSAGGIGDPPPPLYVWDLLMEVGEARLHDEGVAQGQADMAFPLRDLPIGLTADELVEKLRPKLDEQEDELSELLVGTSGLASSKADVFYLPAQGGDGALLFRSSSDAGGGVSYAKPGFFSDAQLTQKVSVITPAFGSSDGTHEKVQARVGAVYYAQDEDGVSYELRIEDRNDSGIGILVRRAGGTP